MVWTGRQVDIGEDVTVGSRGRRLLSGVSCGMFLQIAPVVECSVTFFAGIPCQRLLSGVSCGMLLQGAPAVECGVTFFAGMRSCSCVGFLVWRQRIFLEEPPVTPRSGIRLLSSVRQVVFLQVILPHIGLATFGARACLVCLFMLVAGKCPLTCVGSGMVL